MKCEIGGYWINIYVGSYLLTGKLKNTGNHKCQTEADVPRTLVCIIVISDDVQVQ